MATEYFGKDGLILEHSGEISADRFGAWSGSCRFSIPPDRMDLIPKLYSRHPKIPWLLAERQRLVMVRGFWKVVVDYAGCLDEETEPIYEFNPGANSEPIETHKDFVSTIAGKPSAPLNGAIFTDPRGDISSDDDLGTFSKFREVVEGVRNELAGTQAYLINSNSVWTKSWTRRSAPNDANRIKIDNPPGPHPNPGGNYNWLYLGTQYVRRGGAYPCVARWLLSGPNGWNAQVYPNS